MFRDENPQNIPNASIQELVGDAEDQSILRSGEYILLSKCDDEVFIKNAHKYCQECLGGSWAECSADYFSVQYLTGGLTNYLYLCSLPDDIELLPNEPRKVLIRIFGEIIDQKQRFSENIIFSLLSDRGFGPHLYGVFYYGRIEEFFPNRHLFTRELGEPIISKLIAQKAAYYHCLELPVTKKPTFLWDNFEKYLNMFADIEFTEEPLQSLYASMKERINFRVEASWLKEMLIQLNSPVVFCHNDLQEGNVLYLRKNNTTDVQIIDYDYSCYNYRGFDLGNHFCEWMYEYKDEFEHGYKVYSNGYPTREQQLLFASEYLRKLKEMDKKLKSENLDKRKFASYVHINPVETILYEANRFALASHLFWLFWSIIQAKVSKIEFGYLRYANARLETYLIQKKRLGYM